MGHDFRNDSYSTVYIGLNREEIEDAAEWQMEIQKVWYDTFKDIADEYDIVNIDVSW